MKTWALAPEGDEVETDALCSDFFSEFWDTTLGA